MLLGAVLSLCSCSNGGAGGGAGTAGGSGTAGGTGGSSGCLQIASMTDQQGGFMDAERYDAGFSDVFGFVGGPGSAAGRFHVLTVELYYPIGQVPPAPRTVALGPTNFRQCKDCLLFDTGCDGMGINCQKFFLAQSGSLTLSSQQLALASGSLVGSASNVHFVQWRFPMGVGTPDQAIAGGQCIDVGSVTFNATWP